MKRKNIIEIIFHIFFWLISFNYFINNSFLRYRSMDINEEYISFFLIVIIIYINYFILIPQYFTKQKLYKYFSILLLILFIISIIEFILIKDDILLFTKEAEIITQNSVLKFNFIGILFRDALFIGFFTMFRIYQDAVKSYKLLQKNAELEKQFFISQMESIKSKVNSHFFFNTLNSIYSLIITKSAKAPETVLNLSDLMRYVVGESDKKWVPLEKEINFLQYYIELEKVKDSFVNLSFETSGIITKHEVPPMIFESFVNNAFKYTDFRNKGYVKIKIDCEPDKIIFTCKNTINTNPVKELKSTKRGLINTRNRLNLIYDNNYKLDIKDDDGYFTVNLLLKKQS